MGGFSDAIRDWGNSGFVDAVAQRWEQIVKEAEQIVGDRYAGNSAASSTSAPGGIA
ncbi:hypothetical protein [Neorhizobium sp. DAR64860/K0K1]|uniref:hypothetical protein n=1 Tax=Neorhizobium sp. DAR64860/K0K1 TaxID=3421955 RepID=UPI003D27AAE0